MLTFWPPESTQCAHVRHNAQGNQRRQEPSMSGYRAPRRLIDPIVD